jgi:hypothetical protein
MRWRRVLLVAAIVAALALVGGAIGGYVWLDHYAPLGLTGSSATGYQKSGLRAYVEAVPGSEGKDVVFPQFRRGRDYFVGTTIWNDGRFDVTLLGVATDRFSQGFVGMYPRDLRAVRHPDPVEGGPGLRDTSPTNHLVIKAHGERFVWIGFRMTTCRGLEGYQGWYSVPLRYRYLGHFTHVQEFELPLGVTLVCNAPLPRTSRILRRDGHSSRSRAARAAAERADAVPARPDPGLRRTRPRF